MSFVNNALVTGFPAADGAPYQPPNGNVLGNALAAPSAASDAIACAPVFRNASNALGEAAEGGLYGGSSSGSTGLGGFAGIMNGFMNMLASALGSLSGMFGGSGTTQPVPWQGPPPATPDQQQQQFFTNATASSVGDPHDAFSGTTANGTSLGSTWDNMEAHPYLLDSNSFAGGYRVSTTSTAPQANGITYNSSATVTTDRGATSVTMNADGSYAVTENGQNVTLQEGQAIPLDGTESVTLNANGSLSIVDQNARGGSISTTLKSNGDGGVDVNASASNVDLGGYLVGRADVNANGGGVHPFQTNATAAAPATAAAQANAFDPLGTQTTQLTTPNSQLGDIMQLVQQDVADL